MTKKEFYTIDEAAKAIDKSKASLYIYMKKLGIKPRSFSEIDKKRVFLSAEEVDRIKNVRVAPWKVETTKEKADAATKTATR